jgi:hypothetical protein
MVDYKLRKLTEKQLQKEFLEFERARQIETLQANKSRAQSITVGTAGGGTTEITMRSTTGAFMWNTYQPVEIVELINQLAAGIGCHIHIIPRTDFASWRDWKYTEAELAHFRGEQRMPGVGHSPHAKFEGFLETGLNMPHPEEQPGMEKQAKEKENVATKKAVNKRSTKRSRTSTK